LPWYLRSAHLFDRYHASQCPEIGICYPRVFRLDRFKEDASMLETGVGWVAAFSFVTHASSIATTSVCLGVVCAGGVPMKRMSDGGVE
jgi:hypothetical protein